MGLNKTMKHFKRKVILSNKYSLILYKLSLCIFFRVFLHSHWRVVYCFSLIIQTHARNVVYILWLVVDLKNY